MASNSALSSNAQRLFNDAEKTRDGKINPDHKWDQKKYKFDVKSIIQELSKKGKFETGWARRYEPKNSVIGPAVKCLGEMCGFNMGPQLIGYYNRRQRTRKGSRKNNRKGSRKNNRK
jgi:hypothetical protein